MNQQEARRKRPKIALPVGFKNPQPATVDVEPKYKKQCGKKAELGEGVCVLVDGHTQAHTGAWRGSTDTIRAAAGLKPTKR